MHTVKTADEVEATKTLVMEVEVLDKFSSPDLPEPANNGIRVFTEANAEWVVPETIATFDEMANHLWKHTRTEPDQEVTGCIVLRDPEKARPQLALTDPRMPTCLVTEALDQQGWIAEKHFVEHKALLPPGGHLPYDGRSATRQKWYYHALATLPVTLPLCSGTLPSAHPVHFYRLLLRGEAVRPGMGAKHYTQLWNKNKHTKKADLVPIEGVPPPAPIDDEEEFFEPDLDGNAPKRQSRPAAPRGPRRGGDRGRGSGRGSGRGADPPAPIVDGPPPTLHPVPAPGPGGGHGGDGGGEGGGEGGHTDEPAEEFFGGPDEPERRPRRARQGPKPIESIGGVPVVLDPY